MSVEKICHKIGRPLLGRETSGIIYWEEATLVLSIDYFAILNDLE